MSRYKPKGWRGEPHRHYLAAKGIKTKNFDLSRYAGEYKQSEVFNEPWFQTNCDEVRAKYGVVDDDSISVNNICIKDGDVKNSIEGTAEVIEDGRLKVDFGLFRKGDYEIVAVTPDYKNAIVKGGDTVWVLEKDESKYFVSKDDSSYKKWRKLVNMSPHEVEKFAESDLGKKAGLSRQEAAKKGIRSGRDSARAIVRMREKPLSKWNDTDEEWMGAQNSFVARMKGNTGPLYDENGDLTRKHTSLKIWGHDPERKRPWDGGNTHPDYDELFAKKERLKKSAPKFKKAFKTSLHPRELIIPSSKQEQEWAEGLYTFITGKEPKTQVKKGNE